MLVERVETDGAKHIIVARPFLYAVLQDTPEAHRLASLLCHKDTAMPCRVCRVPREDLGRICDSHGRTIRRPLRDPLRGAALQRQADDAARKELAAHSVWPTTSNRLVLEHALCHGPAGVYGLLPFDPFHTLALGLVRKCMQLLAAACHYSASGACACATHNRPPSLTPALFAARVQRHKRSS